MDEELLTRIRKEAYEQGYQDGKIDGYNLIMAKQVNRKKGKWIWVDGVRCSKCNHKLQTTGLPSFCPNCIAQMDTFDFVKEET